MKKVFLVFSLVLFITSVFSQSTSIKTFFNSNIKKGDYFFDHFAYRNALGIYLHAYEKDTSNIHLLERIGECYFKLHEPAAAEKWFEKFVNGAYVDPRIKFEYAEALSMTGDYHLSKIWFEKYLQDKPNDKIAKNKLYFLNHLSSFTDDKHQHRFNANVCDFNTELGDYGAHFFQEGVVFASSRDQDLFIKQKPSDAIHPDESLLNLYYVGTDVTGDWEQVQPFHKEHLKSYFHEGPMAFYDKFQKGAFTQSNISANGLPIRGSDGRVHLKIFFAEVASLGELKNISAFEHNDDDYSVAHPSFSKDGSVMYFTSTGPGTLGASDIFYCVREGEKWGAPISVGPSINTAEDESFPYLANDTTLYFSSNGHGTFGGLDVYVAYKRKNNTFSNPVNLGGSLNSKHDDFSFVIDSTGRMGFLSSNRPGGMGLDDIYFYTTNFYFLAGQARELGTLTNIPNAVLTATNTNGDEVASAVTDSSGYFLLALPFDQDFNLNGSKDGYETLTDVGFTTRGRPFGVDSIIFPMWSHGLFAKGRIYSNETEQFLPGATMTLENITLGTKQTMVVSDSGDYVFLVRPDMEYRIEGSKTGFINNGFKLNTSGLLKGDLVNDIVLEEVFIDRVSFNFDFNKADVGGGAAAGLDRLVKVMMRYPSSTLNIGAHADSRGSAQYNKALSERRALSIVSYITSKGISRKRIEYTAFGETLLLNQCSDGVICPEEGHAENRRTDIKIQKFPIK
jgi:outer membrane protein OmpA-like peptidoglycan-associated protein